MILTNEEMDRVRTCLEAQAGLDPELHRRCAQLVHQGQFDEAVRSAFVLLEERLRDAAKAEGKFGTRLAESAFDPDTGPLSASLVESRSERIGLQQLFAGAFRLFRNPTAHGVVGYGPAEGKAILGLVDLLLIILKRAAEVPPPGLLPENVEAMLKATEEEIGAGGTSRLRSFLGRCVQLGLQPPKTATVWIPFKRFALYKPDHWDEPRPYRIAVFYLGSRSLSFPTTRYYARVPGFDVEGLVEELTELGFSLSGKERNRTAALQAFNSQAFFDSVLSLLKRVADELEDLLQGE